jgi:hypothetical protein
MQKYVVLTKIEGEPVDELHGRAVRELQRECSDLRWYSSYRVSGPYDYVDVVELQKSGDASKPAAVLDRLGFARSEWLPAEASEWLRAPGSPGGAAPGAAPGGAAPGAAPGGAPG